MAIWLTEDELRRFDKGDTPIGNEKGLLISEPSAPPVPAKGVFLSYSHEDKDLVTAAANFLKSQGVPVFVDSLDQGMPEEISFEIAEKLKNKMKEFRKFVLLASEKSKDSKWIPWLLGIADGHKTIDLIAVLPVKRSRVFSGSEYLDIYPKIENYKGKWLVRLNTAVFEYLPNWLIR